MNYEELIKEIKKHNHLYYDLSAPEISDAAFDVLYDKLLEIEKTQGWVNHDSPSLKVGGTPGKVKHPVKLYSLKKVYDKNEVDPEFDVETPKIDGSNLTLVYDLKKGKINLALTRGDGNYGEDVTHLAVHIKNIPTIATDSHLGDELIITGECVTENKVENFRNYVSGALGLKNPEEFKTRNILFIVHDVLNIQNDYEQR